ncbi:hypothetical protein BGZ83_005973 [Gryganskiella cystojenkinii]|nr:hypothetical protein BGZ83_005973 [Gryganskiella cystojenkinii]
MNALDIRHDIRHHVGQFLDKKTALACIFVSKAWLESFQPFVYQKVKLQFAIGRQRGRLIKMPTLRNLQKYGAYVRDLDLEAKHSYSYDDPLDFPSRNNNDLDLPPQEWHWAKQFLIDHPKISRLSLQGLGEHGCVARAVFCCGRLSVIEYLIDGLSNLTSITCKSLVIKVEDVSKLMTVCRRLDSFVVDRCDILNKRVEDRQEEEYGYIDDEDEEEEQQEANEHEQSSSREPRSTKSTLKTLYLRKNVNLGLATALRWVSRCPNLQWLHWQIDEVHKDISSPDFSLLSHCPRLFRLTIIWHKFREASLAQFLKNCPNLTEITLRGERMNNKTFDALKPRFGQLRKLNLFEITDMKSWMVGVILSDCPNLIEFAGGVVEVDPAGLLTSNAPGRVARGSLVGPPISSRPWACTRLRRIRFAAIKWSEDEAINDFFLDRRLAALKELEEFTSGGVDADFHVVGVREECEMEGLARSGFYGGPLCKGEYTRSQMLKTPDMRWMTTTWPRLQKFKNEGSLRTEMLRYYRRHRF